MKRLTGAVLALVLLLCACSSGPAEAPYTVDDADTLLAADGLFSGELAPVDSSIAAMLYGIDEAAVVDCICYLAMDTSTSADELTIFIMDNEAAAKVAETACQLRVDSQIKVCEGYCPAAVPRLEGAVIRRVGSSVLLAVGDPDLLPDAVDALRDSK